MFQALTGCDTASVLNLLDMDRKLHRMPAMELIARACYTGCAPTDIQEHKCAELMYVQRIPPTHTALEHHVKSAVFQGGHVGVKSVSHNLCFLLWCMAWDKTGNGLYEPHWTTFPRPTTVGYLRHARKDVVAAASAKRLHALLLAGVKQLGKEIIQF